MSKQGNISTSECVKCGDMYAHEGPEIKNFKCNNCQRQEFKESQKQDSGPNAVFNANKALGIVDETYENGQWKTTYADGTVKYGFSSRNGNIRKSRSTRKRSVRKSRAMRRKSIRKSIRRKSLRKSTSRKTRKSTRKSRSRK